MALPIQNFRDDSLLDKAKSVEEKTYAVRFHFPPPLAASLWPGLLLTGLIAGIALALRTVPGISVFSPMIIAILIGIAFQNAVGTPVRAIPGVKFSIRRLLRLAIILLGLQLTTRQIVEAGGSGVAIIAATLTATFLFTLWLGRRLDVDGKLAQLIAAGTSICGASAVIAANTVTEASDEDVAYAVACVTVFGSLAMFLYPLLPAAVGLGPKAFGLWAGASIHEIAQVIAAAFQDGQSAGEFGTIAKLSRVAMLAPVIMAMGWFAARGKPVSQGGARPQRTPIPWFVLGFVAMIAVNSIVTVPTGLKAPIVTVTAFLLSMALAAMGLETDIRKLRAKGVRPLVLGAGAWIFIGTFSLGLIKWIG